MDLVLHSKQKGSTLIELVRFGGNAISRYVPHIVDG
jgi:hypothetical protein